MPSDDSQQLDLFADSGDVMRRNDAIDAVCTGVVSGQGLERPAGVAAAPAGGRAGLDSLPERAFRSICELLGLERQGRHAELVAGRKRLRALAPALYAVYMKTR